MSSVVKFAVDSLLEGGGFELPVPLATERLSCQLDALGGVLFGELGFGLTNHQDREGSPVVCVKSSKQAW